METNETGLVGYLVRSWQAFHHHITLARLFGIFFLTPEQEWKEILQVARPQISRVLRELLPEQVWTPEDLLQWLTDTPLRNKRPKRSHVTRRCVKLMKLSL
jgi:hypothetical protein